MFFTSTIAAFIPTLIYIAIIYWVDRYEKEPIWLLASAFLWGAIPSVIVALIFNGLFGVPFYILLNEEAASAMTGAFVAPLVEETAKGLALVGILYFWRSQIDSVLDGIIYGAMVGLGFAMIENIFYFVDAPAEDFGFLVIMRAYIFGLNHSLFTAATGFGIAIARLTRKPGVKVFAPFLGWMAAVFLHFVHNAAAGLSGVFGIFAIIPLFINAWGGLLLLIVIIFWALRQERSWIKKYLAHELANDTIATAHYEIASSNMRRILAPWRSLRTGNVGQFFKTRRFYDKCAKLAYACHHAELYQDEEAFTLVEELRGWVKENRI